MKKKDFIIILLVLLAMVGTFGYNKLFNGKDGNYAEIYIGEKLYGRYPLNKDQTFEIDPHPGEKNIVYIHDGGIEVKEANCPDQICVKTNLIKKPGQSIICLPHKLNIKIVGNSNDSVDVEVK